MANNSINKNVKKGKLETKAGFCPKVCKGERTFTRVDEGVALIGNYRCNECKTIYHEVEIYPSKDYADLIRERLKKRK